jgi:hypothetical protein
MKRNRRHDAVALDRQKSLAPLLILSNLGVGGFLVGVMLLSGWDPELSTGELIACVVVGAVSALALLVAAGFVEWLPQLFPSLYGDSVRSGRKSSASARFVARNRMVFYYVGVWSNFFAIALVTEFTGGLLGSPFVALLIAFVLTGQQLSRFRKQSGALLATGLLVALAMLKLESHVATPSPPAPDELEAASILLALAAGGLLSYFEKSHNYLIEKHVRPPSHVRIYADGLGIWRFAFYRDIHRQDPVLLAPHDPSTAPRNGGFPPELKARFEKLVEAMAADAKWPNRSLRWPTKCEDSFSMDLAPDLPDELD